MSEYSYRYDDHHSGASLRLLIGVALAGVAGFAAAAFTLNQAVTEPFWRPDLGTYSQRLLALAQHKTEVDTLFIGSSHIEFAIDALEFDAATAALGEPTSSFKLGVRSMTIPWVLHILAELRRIDFPNLQRVFLEPRIYPLSDLDAAARWQNAASIRSRYISSLSNTLLAVRVLWSSNITTRKKLGSSVHLAHNFWLNVVNLGVLPDILIARPVEQNTVDEIWAQRGNNMPVEGRLSPNLKLIAPSPETGYRPLSEDEVAILGDYVAGIEALGARPYIIFVPGRDEPGLRSAILQVLNDSYPTASSIGGELDFTQATGTYSQAEIWWDTDHLNQSGAELFSVDIAAEWLGNSTN